MEKIDYFGGTHGNFLELMINLFIYQVEYTKDDFFNENGACHRKHDNPLYKPKIKCEHYSYNNVPVDNKDNIIEIHCSDDDMLLALTNSLLRAGIPDGGELIDLDHLERDTISKLSKFPKAGLLLNDLINEHGVQTNYPRATIRNYFYSKFDNPEYGVNIFNNFNNQCSTMIFPISAFFNLEDFYLNLNKCAFFLNMNFYPDSRTVAIWEKFVEVNQGYHSQEKCDQVMSHILSGKSMNISNLNLLEEAWILYRLSQIFRCYDHPLLNVDQFVTDTADISRITYEWKKGDYPSRP